MAITVRKQKSGNNENDDIQGKKLDGQIGETDGERRMNGNRYEMRKMRRGRRTAVPIFSQILLFFRCLPRFATLTFVLLRSMAVTVLCHRGRRRAEKLSAIFSPVTGRTGDSTLLDFCNRS